MTGGIDSSRYRRHRQIHGLDQDALARLRVLVIGAGAIGNEVVKNLTLLGVGQAERGEIRLHDLDRVERHNLTRSVLLREADIGQDKASAVAAHARELEPAVRITAVHGNLFETLRLADVLDSDIVIAGLDNIEARIRINQLCWLAGKPWINAAIDSRHASVEVFDFAQVDAPACYECTLPETAHARLAERRSCGGLLKAALAERVMPTTTITTSIAAALAVNQALLLTGCDNRVSRRDEHRASVRLFCDSLVGTTGRSELTPAGLCAGCGSLPYRPTVHEPVGTVAELTDALSRLTDARGQPPVDAGDACTIEATPVSLGDAVITDARCTRCQDPVAQGGFTGRRAAAVTDAITVCARCASPSVAVDIRSDFTLAQLRAVFADRPLPNGWLIAGQQLFATGVAQPTQP